MVQRYFSEISFSGWQTSLNKFHELIRSFEKFMKKYDKGDDLNDILISYFNGKTSLIEAINRKILYEEFIDFEKIVKE